MNKFLFFFLRSLILFHRNTASVDGINKMKYAFFMKDFQMLYFLYESFNGTIKYFKKNYGTHIQV